MAATAAQAQNSGDRLRSGTPLRGSQTGNTEVVNAGLAQTYGLIDTARANKLNGKVQTALGGNPNATRFMNVQAICNLNSIRFTWIAVQQQGAADRYEIEQSNDDGLTWTVIGVIPATRTEPGEASYSYDYNKNLSTAVFRITAVNLAGERVSSALMQSACSSNFFLAVTPNPVISTTTVRIGSPTASRVKLLLVNQSGAIVQNREAAVVQGTNQVPLDMSSLQKGFYTLSIVWKEGQQEVMKLIKQ